MRQTQSSNLEQHRDPHSASFVLSSSPPFYRIDWTNNSIEPRQPCFESRKLLQQRQTIVADVSASLEATRYREVVLTVSNKFLDS